MKNHKQSKTVEKKFKSIKIELTVKGERERDVAH